METGSRNAISIKLQRSYCTNRPKDEKIDTGMEVSRLISDSALWEKKCPNPEVKPHLVTSIRNNTSSSPYNLRVTGKWTVRNKTRKLPTLGAFSWFCFLIFLLSANTYFFRHFHKQYKECLQAVRMLENMVKHLEEETRDLQEKLNSSPQNNVPSTYPSLSSSHAGTELSFDPEVGHPRDFLSKLIRSKRSNGDGRSDRKERKRSKS